MLSSLIPARVPVGTPALTVRQPWASLIIEGTKDVENRGWSTYHRGPLIIHAGNALDREALAKHRRLLQHADSLPHGCLLGTVDLVDCVERARSRWAEPGAFHWLLRDPRPFRSLVPMRGSLGLWQPERQPLDGP
jgi:ASCH domain